MKNVTSKRQPAPKRRARMQNVWLKAFIWVFLAIFIFGSVGVALVATSAGPGR